MDPVRCDGYLTGASAREFAMLFVDEQFLRLLDKNIQVVEAITSCPDKSFPGLELKVLRSVDGLPWPLSNREHTFAVASRPVVNATATADANCAPVWYHIAETMPVSDFQLGKGNVWCTKYICLSFEDRPEENRVFGSIVVEADPRGNIPSKIVSMRINAARTYFANLSKTVQSPLGVERLKAVRQQIAAVTKGAKASAQPKASDAEAGAEATKPPPVVEDSSDGNVATEPLPEPAAE